MKRMLAVLMVALVTASLVGVTSADAKRLGGGKSIGMKREAISSDAPKAPAAQPTPAAPPANAAPTPTTPAPRPAGASRWLAPLIGFGLGAALMSMFGGGPIMGAIGNLLMLAVLIGAVFFVINLLRRRTGPAATTQPIQYAGIPASAPTVQPNVASAPSPTNARTYPPGFDADGFLREAKVSFIRLQAANDVRDLSDIRDYTTPELYAELAMQMQERGDTPQKTDVLTINTELLDVAEEPDRAVASVRFTGLVREEEANGAERVDETWHVVKDLKNGKSPWLIAGIQQNA